jgi:hypothetical protein
VVHRTRGLGRGTGAGMAGTVVLAALLLGLVGSPAATAAILDDRDPAAPIVVGDRVGALDATIRQLRAELPAAQVAVEVTTAAAEAAEQNLARTRVQGVPLARTDSGGALDAATTAILGDLAPEHATAGASRARQDAAAAIARRDQMQVQLTAATEERSRIVAELPAAGQHRTHWSIALLDLLGAPVTGENLRLLAAWIGAEANDVTLRNPLATTMPSLGARSVNDHGVKGYPSDEIGLDATVRTLRLGAYTEVVAALMRGDSAVRVATAIAASPWGTGENVLRRLQMDRR